MTSFYIPETYGNDPINTQWKVVRGDTASLKIEFFEILVYDTATK
jgi:hypothetical protein